MLFTPGSVSTSSETYCMKGAFHLSSSDLEHRSISLKGEVLVTLKEANTPYNTSRILKYVAVGDHIFAGT